MNRLLANADGLEYYMLYDGYKKIQSGIYPFILSITGIYIKRIFGIEYKNIGHKLSELALGESLNFAQSSNYTLFLQIMVFGYYFSPFYVILVSYLTARLRNLVPKGSMYLHMIYFFLISNSFFIVTDPEYGLLKVLSFFTILSLFIYPIIKIRFFPINQKTEVLP